MEASHGWRMRLPLWAVQLTTAATAAAARIGYIYVYTSSTAVMQHPTLFTRNNTMSSSLDMLSRSQTRKRVSLSLTLSQCSLFSFSITHDGWLHRPIPEVPSLSLFRFFSLFYSRCIHLFRLFFFPLSLSQSLFLVSCSCLSSVYVHSVSVFLSCFLCSPLRWARTHHTRHIGLSTPFSSLYIYKTNL